MLTAADARRRWFGALFLALAAGLLIWGQTVLKGVLTGWGFVLYWLACFVLTGLAMLVALWDIRVVRQRIRADQKALWDKALGEMQTPGRKAEGRRQKAEGAGEEDQHN